MIHVTSSQLDHKSRIFIAPANIADIIDLRVHWQGNAGMLICSYSGFAFLLRLTPGIDALRDRPMRNDRLSNAV